ncbi:MAG: hypothetical protein MJ056_01610 [Akkermansia sp.]|nr:hypothetical protein [Akkermansia sp.]
MNTTTLAALCAVLAIIPANAQGQQPSPQNNPNSVVPRGEKVKEMNAEKLPAWLVSFSNLPKADRQKYLQGFARAKEAFQKGDWNGCILEITNCEIIFNENPNSWNLRLSCMIELKQLEHADEYLEKVKQELPKDPVTLLNIANLHMVRQEFQPCIDELTNIIRNMPYDTEEELINIMRFRIMLCHLMLGHEDLAEDIIKDLSPLDDTPLYYYGKAAINIYYGKRQDAMMDVNSANNIFSKNQATVPYQRGITASGLIDKYLPEVNKPRQEAEQK